MSSDRWVTTDEGEMVWGAQGASGVLAYIDTAEGRKFFLHQRASWVDHGGTWGIPVGAIQDGLDPVTSALVEFEEETGVPGSVLRVERSLVTAQKGSWTYTTVIARAVDEFISDGSHEANGGGWWSWEEMGGLNLHPDFSRSIGDLRRVARLDSKIRVASPARGLDFKDMWGTNKPSFSIYAYPTPRGLVGSTDGYTSIGRLSMEYDDAANGVSGVNNFLGRLNDAAENYLNAFRGAEWVGLIERFHLVIEGRGNGGNMDLCWNAGEASSLGESWGQPRATVPTKYRQASPSGRFLSNAMYGSKDEILKFLGVEVAGVVIDDSLFDDVGEGQTVTIYRGISVAPGVDPLRSIDENGTGGVGRSWTLELDTAKAIAERGQAGFTRGPQLLGDTYEHRIRSKYKGEESIPVPTVLRATVTIRSDGGAAPYRPWTSDYSSEREIDVPRGTQIVIDGVLTASFREQSTFENEYGETYSRGTWSWGSWKNTNATRTAAWRDVQQKARRIKSDGNVRILNATDLVIAGEVRGDNGTYQTSVMFEPGTKRTAFWECGCPWASYSWGRSGRWRKFEGRLCFIPGSMVSMADGTFKAIEDIQPGDWVVTHDGIGQVSDTMERQHDGEVVSLRSSGYADPIVCTPEHPLLGWGTPQRLRKTWQENDGQGFKFYDERFLWQDHPVWIDADAFDRHDWLVERVREVTDGSPLDVSTLIEGDVVDGRFSVGRSKSTIPSILEPTTDLGFLIGFYIAEGSMDLRRNEIQWSVHEDEVDDLVKKLGDVCRRYDLGEARVYHRSTSKAASIRLSNAPLAKLIIVLCGNGSHTKKLHPWLMGWRPHHQQSIIDAWFDGDGHQNGSRKGISTVGDMLARQLYDLLTRCNHVPSWTRGVNNGGPSDRLKKLEINFVSWVADEDRQMANGRRKVEDWAWAVKVSNVSRSPYEGPVYDITVPGSHSFVVNGRVVHNCAHALAVLYEAQSRGMYGGEITPDEESFGDELTWHDPGPIGDWRLDPPPTVPVQEDYERIASKTAKHSIVFDRDDFLAMNATIDGDLAVHFVDYGDAVPGGYNGGWAAMVDGQKVGYLDYQSASHDDTVLIAMVEVDPEWRRRGIADALLGRLRREFPDRKIDPGYTTSDGSAWWNKTAAKIEASGLIIRAESTGRVLMVQRTPYHGDDEETAGRWEFPGGHVEAGEDPLVSAIREFGEETGLELPEYEVVDQLPEGNYVAYVLRVHEESWTTNAELLSFETMGIGWFDYDEMADGTDEALRGEVYDMDLSEITAEGSIYVRTAADAEISECDRQENQTNPFDGVTLDQDDDGWYVKTHRCRSDSYPTADDIPVSTIEFIRSTGATGAVEAVTATSTMVCIVPPAEIAEWLSELPEATQPIDQIHCTLLYLGKPPTDDYEAIVDTVADWVADQESFEVTVGQLGTFDNPGEFVTWAGVESPELVALQASLDERMGDTQWPNASSYSHNYVPHITLSVSPEEVHGVAAVAALPMTVTWPVTSVWVAQGDRWTEVPFMSDTSREALLHEEPAPALPRTDGSEDDEMVDDSMITASLWDFLGDDSMDKTAARQFSGPEQQAIINEDLHLGGVQARNLDRLDLSGTHYVDDDDEIFW